MLIANSISAAAKIAETEREQQLNSLGPPWLEDEQARLQDLDRTTQQAIDTFLHYQRPNGSIHGIGWWQIANGYTAIVLSDLWSGRTHNYDLLATAIRQCEKRQSGLINVFNDDTCWWALLCIHMYSLQGDDWFLGLAERIWQHIRDDGSVCARGQVSFKGSDMEGAVYWKARKSKNDHINAISTGLYAELSARLALLRMRKVKETQDQHDRCDLPDHPQHRSNEIKVHKYTETARCCLGWILRCRYRPRKGVVLDHLELGKERAVDWTFTYNTGVALGVCALLFEITRDDDYMTLACHMARQSMLRRGWVEENGVLTEKGAYGRGTHDPFKPNDAVGFKSVLMRQLATLYEVIKRTQCCSMQAQKVKDMIQNFISINYQSQQDRNTDGKSQYGPWWNGPYEFPTSHSQMAVLDVFAAANLMDHGR